jgi:hypothetical protein
MHIFSARTQPELLMGRLIDDAITPSQENAQAYK